MKQSRFHARNSATRPRFSPTCRFPILRVVFKLPVHYDTADSFSASRKSPSHRCDSHPLQRRLEMMGLRWDIAHMSMISLLYNTISWLFLLTIFSRVIKHVSPRFALSHTELLTIYVMLSLSTAIGGHMCVQMLAPIVSYAFAYATQENDWQALFWRYIPEWSSVRDKTVLDDFYRGSSSFYMPGYLRTWLFPLLIWSAFLVMLGINFIVRRQWTENEKLSYPLIQLPLAMTSQTEPFFRNRLMWMGFGVAAFIDLLDGLNYLYPNIPRIGGIRGYGGRERFV